MKKNLFLLAVAAVALASCSNDQVVSENTTTNQPKEIAFFPVNQNATRAPQTAATYDHGDDFDVVAYLAEGGSSAGDYFPSTNFKYDYAGSAASQSSGYWAGTTARYWPLTASTINFLAVSNKAGSVTGKVSTTFGETSANYAKKAVVALTGNQGYQQTDLMYAAGQGRVTRSVNTLSYNVVNMEFQHALAMVGFQVKTSTSDTNVDIKVNSITLNGAHYNGTYTITNDGSQKGYDGNSFTNAYNSTADLTATSSWTNMVGVWSGSSYTTATQMVPKADYSENPAAQSATLTATPAAFGGYLLVIPDGSAATEGANVATGFTMNYTITMGEKATTYDYTYTFANAEKMWKQRKKYTYILDITLHEIFVNATVEEWEENDPHIVAIPQYAYAENAVAGIYNVANTECTYTATITGCANSTAYTLTESADWISEVPASITSDDSGNLTFKFKVSAQAANAGARNADITFTNSTLNTKVTIKQAAGPAE